MSPEHYMTRYYGAELVEEYPTGSNEPFCCDDYRSLIELSNGYVDVGYEWDKLWSIEAFVDTRNEIKEHNCDR